MDDFSEPCCGTAELHPSMLVGVPVIDEQHRALVVDLNRLLADPAAKPGTEAFGDVLSQLGIRLSRHFETEERYFGALGLPPRAAEAHRAAHADILQQYTELNFALMRRNAVGRADALRMVRQWVLEHIATHDAHLGVLHRGGAGNRRG